jgi:hypothetical protein
LKKYSILFAITYFIVIFGLGEIAERYQIDAAMTLNFFSTVLSVFIAALWFARQQNRRPSHDEVMAFSWQGLAGVWIASIISTAIMFTFFISPMDVMAMLKELSMAVIVVGALIGGLIACVIYFFLIRFSFSAFTKMLRPA